MTRSPRPWSQEDLDSFATGGGRQYLQNLARTCGPNTARLMGQPFAAEIVRLVDAVDAADAATIDPNPVRVAINERIWSSYTPGPSTLGFRRRCGWCGRQLRGWQLNMCRRCKTAAEVGGSSPCVHLADHNQPADWWSWRWLW